MRTHILADTDVVQSFKPNFDGPNGTSITFTCILKNGKQFSFPCKGPEDFPNAEIIFKKNTEYDKLKKIKDKEKADKK